MRRVFVVVLALGLLAALATPSPAIDQGSMGVMGPTDSGNTKTHINTTFPPVAGVYPSAGAHPFAAYRPFTCGTVTYCARHTFEVMVPDGYLSSLKGKDIVSYGVRVRLTWDNPAANDLDLFVWPDDDPSSGAPQGPCQTPEDEECTGMHPEQFNVVEPKPDDDPATPEVDESKVPAPTFISVVNGSGVNTGYTIDLQWFLVPFESFEAFQPPQDREVSRQVTQSRTPAPFSLDDGSDQPDGDTKILIPGPDGELIEQELGFYAAGNRVPSDPARSNSWVWITSAAISALAVAAFVYFVIQRRRREAL